MVSFVRSVAVGVTVVVTAQVILRQMTKRGWI